MKKLKWNEGKPPSKGWWPASIRGNADAHRWWNGKYWSQTAYRYDSILDIAYAARTRDGAERAVMWLDRPEWWPARSRT